MTEDHQLIDYLLLLRYGTTHIDSSSTPILNFTSISKVIGKSVESVRRLIKLGLEMRESKSEILPRVRTKLSQEHIDYLCH